MPVKSNVPDVKAQTVVRFGSHDSPMSTLPSVGVLTGSAIGLAMVGSTGSCGDREVKIRLARAKGRGMSIEVASSVSPDAALTRLISYGK